MLAAPKVRVNELEVTVVKAGVELKLKVYAPTVPVIRKVRKVATPLDAVTVVVPESVPVPVAMAAVTVVVELVVSTRLPLSKS